MAEMTGQAEFELFAESDTDFFLKVVNAQITFVKDAPDGRVNELVLHLSGRDTTAQKIK
jgi:hypothetical protein